jgi:cardiolipin synthase (CMP-forming)
LSIPNIITLGRIILVPVIVWAIVSSQMEIAFAIFVIAGVSDAVDGFLAKRFNMASELGALLDPLADKALLVSIFVALGIWGAVPRWLVILVVSRDIMVVAARQADSDETADGVEAQHGGAGGVRGAGAGFARLQFQAGAL